MVTTIVIVGTMMALGLAATALMCYEMIKAYRSNGNTEDGEQLIFTPHYVRGFGHFGI